MPAVLIQIPLAHYHVQACNVNSTIYITVASVAALYGAAPGDALKWVRAMLGKDVQLPEAMAGMENSIPSKHVFITLEPLTSPKWQRDRP